MKRHPIHHRILLTCVLLLGTVGLLRADATNQRVPAPSPGSRIESGTGILGRLFGGRAERSNRDADDDDDDDVDERRVRPRGPQSQFAPPPPGTTVITTTRTTTRAPSRSGYPESRYLRVQDGTRYMAPQSLRSPGVPREIQPAPPPQVAPRRLDERDSRVADQTRTVVAPTRSVAAPARSVAAPTRTVAAPTRTVVAPTRTMVAPSMEQTPSASTRFTATKPRSTDLAAADAPSDSLPAPAQVPNDLSASQTKFIAVEPPGPAIAPSSSEEQTDLTASKGEQSAASPGAEQPAKPTYTPSARAVPGRPGLVYVPGQDPSPKNMVDVTGLAPGTKVRDPVSKVIFRVP